MSNVASILLARVADGERPLFRQDVNGTWRDYTARDIERMAAAWQAAFVREGLTPGERIGIGLRNGVQWVAVDMAALGLGLVDVPLYVDDNPGNMAWCASDAGCRLLILENTRLLKALEEAGGVLPNAVVLHAEDERRATQAEAWLPTGELPFSVRDVDDRTLASIVYTSGTSGPPKGVMLSHGNLLFDARAGLATIRLRRDEEFLSLLPLSHMFERTVGYYLPLMHGAKVIYARGVSQLAEDLATQRPTAMVVVPRVLERLHARILHATNKKRFQRWLFQRAVDAGWRRAQGSAGVVDRLVGPILDGLIPQPVRSRLGGRLYLAVAGGAAMNPEISRTFIGLGITVLQGYGMTEASPVISVNRVERNVPESVGEPLPGVEIKIAPDGELLTRGPHVMLGYWNNPEATAAAIDAEGWLHTGDLVEVRDGLIYIRGRAKDVLVLSNGEKLPPNDVEAAVAANPIFQQVMLVGEAQPFLTLLAVTDEGDERKLVKAANEQLGHFPRWVRVRRVIPVKEPWTVENGMLTPTLKLKRREVAKRYARELERAYAAVEKG